MHVDRDSASVILYGDGVVLVDSYLNILTEASHGFIDGIVYSFVDQMMKTFLADVTNIHGWTLAHGLQTLQHLDVTGGIIVNLVVLNF